MAVWFESRPCQILDQHFGSVLQPEDLQTPLLPRELLALRPSSEGYLRPWRSQASQQDVGSTVSFEDDKFQIKLDVQQFEPDELTVKTSRKTITVEGKHEKEDEYGYISRHFVRTYFGPEQYDIDKVESKMTSDKVLIITAPKIENETKDEINIPVIQTGELKRTVPKKKEVKKEKKERGWRYW